MAIYLDLLGAQNRDHGERGIARLISQLALAIERIDPVAVDHYIVHPHLPMPKSIEPLVSSGKLIRSDRLSAQPSGGGTFIAGSTVELDEPMSTVLPYWARGPAWNSVAILYDLIPLKFSDQYLTDLTLKARYLDRVTAYALFDRLLPISQSSRDDAVELLSFPAERQRVIYAGVDERFKPAGPNDAFPEIEGLRRGYVLFPTGIDWRKNIDRTLAAYAALPMVLRQAHQLVLATRMDTWVRESLMQDAKKLGIDDDQLLMTGYVADEMLVRLNQHATVAIFPSLYEGFGLPALEAMQCGTAVICADNSSLREVQPFAPARFDGADTHAVSAILERVLGDQDFRLEIAEQPFPNFSWSRSAGLLIESLGEPKAPQRPRLALVSPFPPQPSGIAQYSARLAVALAEMVDVTLFSSVNDEEGNLEFGPVEGCAVKRLGELESLHCGGQPFDLVVYMMGNSRFHISAFEIMQKVPGAVIFHDARYTGLYNEIRRLRPELLNGRTVGQELERLYPNRYRPTVTEQHQIATETADRFGILMTRAIADAATQAFCHSDYAKTLIEIDSGTSVLHVFDLPCPASGPPEWSDTTLVAAFGIVDPAKDPELLIDAMALVQPPTPVKFVGQCEPNYQMALENRAVAAGVDCHFTGPVSDEAFAAEQRRATVAVQLRRFSNGESSGALVELLARGVPTITTELGAASNLAPKDVCELVPDGVSARHLGRHISELLLDRQRRHELTAAGQAYAAENSYQKAAAALLDAVGLPLDR